MKVLFTFGGLPHYYNFVLNRLNKIKDVEIIVAIPAKSSGNVGKGVHQTTDGIEFRFFQLEEYKPLYGKTFLKGFPELLDSEKPDIVVTMWPYILGFFFNRSLRSKMKRDGIKLIYKDIPFRIPKFEDGLKYGHGYFPDENLVLKKPTLTRFLNKAFLTLLRKQYYKIIDAHVNYVEEAVEILGSYGVEKGKIFVTYNSPDTDMLLSAKSEAGKLEPILPVNQHRIIHIGRLVRWKKVHLLLEAVAMLKKDFPGIELLVVGGGPEEVKLKSRAAELNISENVIFIGAVYDQVTLARYKLSSSVYVLAGMGGLSINEAMTMNMPVICSVCDGTEKNLVIDDYNGKFFEEDSAEDLADKIEYIISDPARIKEMGENSGRIIGDKININTVIDRYMLAFKFVLGK